MTMYEYSDFELWMLRGVFAFMAAFMGILGMVVTSGYEVRLRQQQQQNTPAVERVIRTLLLLAALLLVASPAAAQDTLFVNRTFQAISVLDPNPILAGNDLVFLMDSAGDASVGFTWPIPALPPSCCTTGERWTLTEADATTYAIDWNALEAIFAGPSPKTLHFGPEGFVQAATFQLLAGPLSSATINEISFTFKQADTRWESVYVNFRGSVVYALAPEPSSIVLLLCCSHLLCFRAWWR